MIIIDPKDSGVNGLSTPRSALFLDRDGVVNVDTGYTSKIDDFEWMDGVFDLCRAANNHGQCVIVVTNQGGIGLGRHSIDDFVQLSAWMVEQVQKRGGQIARIVGCPHHPLATIEHYREQCQCRKPAPGMILRSLLDLTIDPAASAMIGDAPTDMEAAARAGIGKRLLLARANSTSFSCVHDAIPVPSIGAAKELLYGAKSRVGDAQNCDRLRRPE